MEHWPKHLKKTKQREEVYQVLSGAAEPLSAQEIFHRVMDNSPESHYAFSTIYRVLSAFEEARVVSKSTLIGEDIALYEKVLPDEHRHYAICLDCHKMIPLKHCPFDHDVLHEISSDGFTITGHKLELYGYCSVCREKRILS